MSVVEIAGQLDLARKTVETHRRRAKEKLGYERIDDLVSHAARWVQVDKHTKAA
jgi:DNA-binding CsgD family transcriptional regulator